MKKYEIKSGDTLSGIGKQYKVSWQEIAKANNITDPKSIRPGQTLTIPTQKSSPKASIDKAPSKNQYTIKSGDTLSEIAQKYGTSWEQLAAINNIKDPRSIQPGQVLNIDAPKLNKSFNQIDTSSTENVKAFQKYLKGLGANITVDGIYGKNTDEARKMFSPKTELLKNTYRTKSPRKDNFQVIQDFYKDKPDAQYVVVDKKKNEMQVYKGGKLQKKYRVGLGSKAGKDYITGITGEKGFSGAGIYNISDKLLWNNPSQEKYFKKLYGENILTLENESGLVQGMAIHQVPRGNVSRVTKLQDSNPNNDDFSWGCINCTKKDYEDFLEYSKSGTKVYVLPEEEDNIFEVKNDRVNFTTTNPEKDFTKYNYTYTNTGNYLDPNIRESTYKPAKYNVPTNSKKAKSFAQSLSDNKKDLMKKMGVDSDTYDRLAQISIGTLGAESDFGKRKLTRNPKTSVYNEELFMDIAEALGSDQSHRSAGLTQLRYNQIPDWVKSDYGITRDDLMNPEKSAIATMAMLSDNIGALRKNRGHIQNMSRENELDFLPYMMNQPSSIRTGTKNGQPLDPQKNTYVSKVLDFANKTNVKTNYNFGGVLSNLSPLLNLAVPGLGTVVGTAASLASQPTNYKPMRQNENPYGFKYGGGYQQGGPLQQEPVKPVRKPGGRVAPNALDKFIYKVDTLLGNPIIEDTERSITFPENTKATAQYKDYLRKAGQTIDPLNYMQATPMPASTTAVNGIRYKDGGDLKFGKLVKKYETEGWDALNKEEQDYYRTMYDVYSKSPNTLPGFTVIAPAVNSNKFETIKYLADSERNQGLPYGYVWNNTGKPKIENVQEKFRKNSNYLKAYNASNDIVNYILGEGTNDPLKSSEDRRDALNSLRNDYMLSGYHVNEERDGTIRAHYNPFKNKMYVNEISTESSLNPQSFMEGQLNPDDFIQESAHAYQNKKYGLPYFFQYPVDIIKSGGQKKSYNKDGTIEHDAHSKIAPKLSEIMYNTNPAHKGVKLTYKNGGIYASGGVYPSGNDKELSSDAYEVDYPGNATDAKSYGPYQFDDNEVIDMMNKFVYSDEKNLGIDGKSPAELVKPLKRAKGKAEKKVEINPYDEHAKNTIQIADMSALLIAQAQETQKQTMPDKKYYKCGGKLRYEKGGPIDEIYQGITKLRPNSIKEYGESQLRKLASKIYDSAYESNIPYQDFTAQLFQESGFNPDVVFGKRRSSAGATGIAQMMPETASRLNVNPANPNEALPASAEEMSRILNKNIEEGYGNSMARAQQRYNAGGPSFKKFMSGSKQLSETAEYPEKIGSHKAAAFNSPAQEYTYRGYIDPDLLNQYAATALRSAPTMSRESTAVRENYQTGGPIDIASLIQGLLSGSQSAGAGAFDTLRDAPNQLATRAAGIDRTMNTDRVARGEDVIRQNDPNHGFQNTYFEGVNPRSYYDPAVAKYPAMEPPKGMDLLTIDELMGVEANKRPNPLEGFTAGDALQGIEALAAFRGLGQGPEIDPLYQMQTRQIDDAPIRRQFASGFNAAASNINTSSAAGRNAALQNLYANRIGQEGDALASLANQNKQLAAQTEQYNIGQRRLTDDINARNRAAFDQAQSAAFTTLGNTGRALNKKKQGKEAMKYLEATYPDVFNFLMQKIQ